MKGSFENQCIESEYEDSVIEFDNGNELPVKEIPKEFII